jgi:hypothetical protein
MKGSFLLAFSWQSRVRPKKLLSTRVAHIFPRRYPRFLQLVILAVFVENGDFAQQSVLFPRFWKVPSYFGPWTGRKVRHFVAAFIGDKRELVCIPKEASIDDGAVCWAAILLDGCNLKVSRVSAIQMKRRKERCKLELLPDRYLLKAFKTWVDMDLNNT